MSIAHHPLADDRGDEQQHKHRDVEDDDTQQQEKHSGGEFCSAESLQPKGIAVPDPRRSSEWPRAQTACVRSAAGVRKDSCSAGLRAPS